MKTNGFPDCLGNKRSRKTPKDKQLGTPITHNDFERSTTPRSVCALDNKRSRKTPKGLQAPSPGQATEGSDTPGCPDAFQIRPRRGQKQRQKRFCHCFCPLRGRFFLRFGQPGVSLAALACPGLGACNPFGVFLERLLPKSRALRFYPLMLEIFAGHRWLTVLVGVGFQQIA